MNNGDLTEATKAVRDFYINNGVPACEAVCAAANAVFDFNNGRAIPDRLEAVITRARLNKNQTEKTHNSELFTEIVINGQRRQNFTQAKKDKEETGAFYFDAGQVHKLFSR